MKHIIGAILAFIAVQCSFAGNMYAQANSCQLIIGQSCWYDPGGAQHLILSPPIPIGATTYSGPPMCADWIAKLYSCDVPDDAAKKTCTTCNQGQAGGPINLATGDTYIVQTDISLPGLGGGLTLTRTWNSILSPSQSYGGIFGKNWRSNFEERLLYDGSDGYLEYARSDGAVWSFGTEVAGSSSIVYRTSAPANNLTRITSGDTNYTLVAHDGSKKLFDSVTGLLQSIIDRNGNVTQLSYDASNRLVTVADPAARHLYFSYPDGSSQLVSSVTSDFGISLSYVYDTQGRLTRATKPDTTTVSFEYDAQSMITAVRDSDGKLLESHTYDALGRGITSVRANGIESVTITYP
jgi:YD repeat-containing protein